VVKDCLSPDQRSIGKDTEPVRQGGYGPVVIVEGTHRGRVGYYDNDEGRKAVVYFGEPFNSDYVLIPRRYLRKTDVTPLELEKFKRRYPDVARFVGVKTER
jgi:hypothetical protein